ncbi:ADP-ribosylglycohydrolase family protein [Paeniglutamicibacter cryotolerans]|uniref:ADP-ribosylglycohydrolase family protein n=1 Tax=Paeniglutamicibacter cryotolerans TaxID=670079 RepID=A0A839QLD6_9MICC|nr:ADP-ribosylglycohydrolase family protein [Paeniglutamicibacter cryotolerans]MBB2996423.1 hypothetical protein [Paeniglutamicibacter cryotolerans]
MTDSRALVPTADFSDRVLAVLAAGALGAGAGSDATGPGESETLALFIMDGLLEAIEWANEGVASDETACMWLAGLRWYKAVTGAFPLSAPEPLTRWIDDELGALGPIGSPADPRSRSGLDSAQMSSTGRRVFPDADGPGVLPRAAAIALLPRVDAETTSRLASGAAALTHGTDAAHGAASLAALMVRSGIEADMAAVTRWTSMLDGSGQHGPAMAALRRAVAVASAALSAGGPSGTRLPAALNASIAAGAGPDEASFTAALIASVLGTQALPAGWEASLSIAPLVTGMHARWLAATGS